MGRARASGDGRRRWSGSSIPEVTSPHTPVAELTEDESWEKLSSVALGRLVTRIANAMFIFPVNFVTQRGTVLFRTAEGSKLFSAAVSDEVLFEADDYTSSTGWSVIVRGTAEVLSGASQIEEAEQAALLPWVATTKLRYVRITPTVTTGRQFVFGPEPDDGSVAG